MKETEPFSLNGIRTVSLKERKSKVSTALFGTRYAAGTKVRDFLESLPRILAAQDLREVIARIVEAKREGKTIILGMGAHVIKVGLSPLIIQLMEEGAVSGIALNGAGAIHDTEVAMEGRTSEEVETELACGKFGMAEETAAFINQGVAAGNARGWGIGRALGKRILEDRLPHRQESILAQAASLDIPVTVHVAFGTDIVHMHPSFNPAAWGEATHLDFRVFASLVATLEGGVYLNIGSAVILPEVFLKALTLVRNKDAVVEQFTTVNMDFIRHYRPLTNVVTRPVHRGGKGYNLVGHHEIMVPLLIAGVLEGFAQQKEGKKVKGKRQKEGETQGH